MSEKLNPMFFIFFSASEQEQRVMPTGGLGISALGAAGLRDTLLNSYPCSALLK